MENFMYLSPVILKIAIVIFGMLSLATLLNLFLKKKSPSNETFQKVAVIIKSWWIIALFIFAGALFGKYGLMVLFELLVLLAIREYHRQSQLKDLKVLLLVFGALFSLIQTGLIVTNSFETFAALPAPYFLATFPVFLLVNKDLSRTPLVIASYMTVLLVAHCLLHMPALIFAGPRFFGDFDSTILVFFLVLGLTQFNDILQFLFGKTFGKRKPVPHLSPNKTEAGFIGALISMAILGGFLFHNLIALPIGVSVILGLCLSLFGMFGDLTFSAAKRYFNIKDFSDALPGHGGYIDRLDSIIFTGPILFYVMKIYMEVNL